MCLGIVIAVTGLVWVAIPGAARPEGPRRPAPLASTTTTTTTAPVSVYGCPIADGDADPDCTDASVVAEYCAVPRESIALPGTEVRRGPSLTRTYVTVAGLPAGVVTHFDEGAGLPDYPMTLECATKRTFGFTAADADAFTEPA